MEVLGGPGCSVAWEWLMEQSEGLAGTWPGCPNSAEIPSLSQSRSAPGSPFGGGAG